MIKEKKFPAENLVSIKIPTAFCKNKQFDYWNTNTRDPIVKTMLEMKNITGLIKTVDFKPYYKATVTKSTCSWYKDSYWINGIELGF